MSRDKPNACPGQNSSGGFRSLKSHRRNRVWNGFHGRSYNVLRGYKGVKPSGQAFARELAEAEYTPENQP
jgi:hypothetical protein